jgi:hypothetical protein
MPPVASLLPSGENRTNELSELCAAPSLRTTCQAFAIGMIFCDFDQIFDTPARKTRKKHVLDSLERRASRTVRQCYIAKRPVFRLEAYR